MDMFMCKGKNSYAIGRKKVDPSFVDSFLNDEYIFTDLRFNSMLKRVFEQRTAVRFDLKNSRIQLGDITSEGDILNAIHAISTYYDLMIPIYIKDGFVKDGVIYDTQGNVQSLPKPSIQFNISLKPEKKIYLDHPHRIFGSDRYSHIDLDDIEPIEIDRIMHAIDITDYFNRDMRLEEKWDVQAFEHKDMVPEDIDRYHRHPYDVLSGVDLPIFETTQEPLMINDILSDMWSEFYNRQDIPYMLNHKRFKDLPSIEEKKKFLENENTRRSVLREEYLRISPYFSGEDIFKSINLESFKDFNQGTDFIILRKNVSTLEALLNECNDALHNKAGIVISELFGKYDAELRDIVKKAPLKECLKISEKVTFLYDRYGSYNSNIPSGLDSAQIMDFLRKGYSASLLKISGCTSFLSYWDDESVYHYAYRFSSEIGSKDFERFLSEKEVYLSRRTAMDASHDKELFAEFKESVDLETFQKILCRSDTFKEYRLKEEVSRKSLTELIEWGLVADPLETLNLLQKYPSVLNEDDFNSVSKLLKDSLVKEYFDEKNVYLNLAGDGLKDLGYWLRTYPSIKETFSGIYEDIVREDAERALRSTYELERQERVNILKSWNKELRRQRHNLVLENNALVKQPINFTQKGLIKAFTDRSFFVVPTFILAYSNKQYKRFIEQMDANEVPYHAGNNHILVYDLRRSNEYNRERIPEKLRNEFRLNPYSTDKQAVGVRKYATTRGASREQQVSYFADVSRLLGKDIEISKK